MVCLRNISVDTLHKGDTNDDDDDDDDDDHDNVLLQPRLVDTLMTAEKHSHYQNSVNCFRKLLGKLWQFSSIQNLLNSMAHGGIQCSILQFFPQVIYSQIVFLHFCQDSMGGS
jgi:hypothetical protein